MGGPFPVQHSVSPPCILYEQKNYQLSTLWIKMIEHRKWNEGRNGLHQLGQPVAPSILFPVCNPPYPQGTELAKKVCPRLRDLATAPAGGIT